MRIQFSINAPETLSCPFNPRCHSSCNAVFDFITIGCEFAKDSSFSQLWWTCRVLVRCHDCWLGFNFEWTFVLSRYPNGSKNLLSVIVTADYDLLIRWLFCIDCRVRYPFLNVGDFVNIWSKILRIFGCADRSAHVVSIGIFGYFFRSSGLIILLNLAVLRIAVLALAGASRSPNVKTVLA